MPLTQTEKDLSNYAIERIGKVIQDIAQSFEIAGLYKASSLMCISPICMRISVQIAVTCEMSREDLLANVARVYDQEVERKTKFDERNKSSD